MLEIIKEVEEMVGGLIVRYEDLVADEATLTRMERQLGLQVDRGVLDVRVGGSDKRNKRLNLVDRAVLAGVTRRVRHAYGY